MKVEKLSKQLSEISEIVKAFQSEAVQLKIVDWLLDELSGQGNENDIGSEQVYAIRIKSSKKNGSDLYISRRRKKFGATKILNQLFATEYLMEPRSISEIAAHCEERFSASLRTSELSGVLLKLANGGKLKRQRSNENNRFQYVKIYVE